MHFWERETIYLILVSLYKFGDVHVQSGTDNVQSYGFDRRL